MPFVRMFLVLAVLSVLSIVAGCGGGGGDGTSTAAVVTPPATSLAGQYKLSSYEIQYENGDHLQVSCSANPGCSGEWVIRSDSYTRLSWDLTGKYSFDTTADWYGNGSYPLMYVHWRVVSPQVFQMLYQGVYSNDQGLSFSQNVLTSSWYMKPVVITNPYFVKPYPDYGLGQTIYFHWTKTSDDVPAAATSEFVY